jgi:hypothetical protein
VKISISVADKSHILHAEAICLMMEEAAKIRGTGISRRKPAYIKNKMAQGMSVIALDGEKVVGFCYIESWEGQRYVANSGLITHPDYRKSGLAKSIKKTTFELSRKKFPKAKLFGITTSLAVMKINSDLGYKPVTFSELTKEETFWSGCQTCPNYDILQRTEKSMCLCTGMVCDLSKLTMKNSVQNKKRSWENFKRFIKLRKIRVQRKSNQLLTNGKKIKNEK